MKLIDGRVYLIITFRNMFSILPIAGAGCDVAFALVIMQFFVNSRTSQDER